MANLGVEGCDHCPSGFLLIRSPTVETLGCELTQKLWSNWGHLSAGDGIQGITYASFAIQLYPCRSGSVGGVVPVSFSHLYEGGKFMFTLT